MGALVTEESPAAFRATTGFRSVLTLAVLVGALGYFVDIYDLVLFGIVRVASLSSMGLSGDALLNTGVALVNWQSAGLLVGGIVWGVMGDKRGRKSVLFGSIALYSAANIANAFVTNVPAYAALRFVAGVGLAGELGAAITLVSETVPRGARGYGTAIVAAFGILGAVLAAVLGKLLSWQAVFIVGGLLGFALLALRVKLSESGMFDQARSQAVPRGDLLMLLRSGRWKRYLAVLVVGIPPWFVIGILIFFSPELARAVGVQGAVVAGTAVLACYLGASIGGMALGVLSQQLGSRRIAIALALGITALASWVYLTWHGVSTLTFYLVCAALGVGAGYWSVFVTSAAEQFGTNLRATVAITAPNLVRGAVIPLTLAMQALRPTTGLVRANLLVGGATILLAALALLALPETHAKDLDYLET